MDTEMIKLKIKCYQKFIEIVDIKIRHGSLSKKSKIFLIK